MIKIVVCFLISLIFTSSFFLESVAAKPVKTEPVSLGILICFSGDREILRKNIVEGPFGDEYKFAREIKILDEKGEHWLNFSGGLCIIDAGSVSVQKPLPITDELSCYSGPKEVVSFEIYGEETTVDQYLEGRTFLAKANGDSINSDSIHQYLVFGGACFGEETQSS